MFFLYLQESLAASKEEGQALYWLEDHVVTDVSYYLSTEIAWQVLWDEARKLSKGDIDDLHKEYGKKQVSAKTKNIKGCLLYTSPSPRD